MRSIAEEWFLVLWAIVLALGILAYELMFNAGEELARSLGFELTHSDDP